MAFGRSRVEFGARSNIADIYRVSRADVVKSLVTPNPRDPERRRPSKVKEVFDPDLRIWIGYSYGRPTEGIKVRTQVFR